MARQERIRCETGYYHIMLRGNERRNIFLDEEDKYRFIDILGRTKNDNRYSIHGLCLMDNHVHIMIHEGMEDISTIMKRITVSYVFYFNKKYKRVGHLFQDRFKSEGIQDDSYVLALIRYIHWNPVKAGIVSTVDQYKWSSYSCYLDEKNFLSGLMDKDLILDFFGADKAAAVNYYKEFMGKDSKEEFMDLPMEEQSIEEEANVVLEKLLVEQGIVWKKNGENTLPEGIIRSLKEKTGLSIRKIAELTGMNKDKVNRILRG